MANQGHNKETQIINLNHLNKDGLLAHIFDMCLEKKDKGIVRFHQNSSQHDKLQLVCIYLNRMKNDLVRQVQTLQRCWEESLHAIIDTLPTPIDERAKRDMGADGDTLLKLQDEPFEYHLKLV
mgnify:CR=1 FL=1